MGFKLGDAIWIGFKKTKKAAQRLSTNTNKAISRSGRSLKVVKVGKGYGVKARPLVRSKR